MIGLHYFSLSPDAVVVCRYFTFFQIGLYALKRDNILGKVSTYVHIYTVVIKNESGSGPLMK